MSDGMIHDLVALFQQMSMEQIGDMEQHLIGNVIEYDPKTHMCRVLLPTRREEDDESEEENQPMETGWIQVGSGMVGSGFGSQYALKGGATAEEPELGEQVQVSVQHRQSGLTAIANLTFNDTMKPPGAGEDEEEEESDGANATDDVEQTKQLKPGERIDRHESGTSVKYYENGDLGIRSTRDIVLHLDIEGDCKFYLNKGNVQLFLTEGNIEAELEKGDITAELLEGDIKADLLKGNVETTVEKGNVSNYVELGDISNIIATGFMDNIVEVGEIFNYIEEGDMMTYVEDGSADIDVGGTVNIVAAGAVDIVAPIINIIGGIINAGTAAFQKLANLFFLEQTFNTHTHPMGGPPVPQAVPDLDTTTDFEAS